MKLTVNECFELDSDYQNQFLGVEVFPEPTYNRLKLSKRSVNQIHYEDIYILEPSHYYYITFNEKVNDNDLKNLRIKTPYFSNGLLITINENKIYLFNASQNIIYLQKGVEIGKVLSYG